MGVKKHVKHIGYAKSIAERIHKDKTKLKGEYSLSNDEKKRIFFTYASFEMLAHTLAYHVPTEINPGATAYNVIDDDGTLRKYRPVKLFTTEPGIVGFVFVPDEASNTDNNSRVHVVFRGTEDLPSVIRDLEYGGAGHETFYDKRHDILQQINGIVGNVHQRTGQKVKLSVSGHSLGGGDAQNCSALLIRAMAHNLDESNGSLKYLDTFHSKIRNNLRNVESLKISHLNSVGVPSHVADGCAEDVKFLAQKSNPDNKINISLHGLRVKNDKIQETGQSNILHDIDPEYARVEVLHVEMKDKYTSGNLLTYLARMILNGILNMFGNPKRNHCAFHFTDDHHNEMSYFSNDSDAGRKVIKRQLTEKSYVENATVTSYFKAAVRKALKAGSQS